GRITANGSDTSARHRRAGAAAAAGRGRTRPPSGPCRRSAGLVRAPRRSRRRSAQVRLARGAGPRAPNPSPRPEYVRAPSDSCVSWRNLIGVKTARHRRGDVRKLCVVLRPGPETGAVPMGTGIVSVALLLDGEVTLSRVLLALTITAWVVLASLAARRLLRDVDGVRRDARSPAALTAVA